MGSRMAAVELLGVALAWVTYFTGSLGWHSVNKKCELVPGGILWMMKSVGARC